jgi:HEAT repeats
MRDARRTALLVLFASLSSCGGAASIRAASLGRIEGLARLVDADVKRGAFDNDDAHELARAVARDMVAHAEGPDGAELVRGFGSCARPIDEALERRAEGGGPVAAAAVLVRVSARLAFSDEDYVPWAKARPGELGAEFRAVGARVLTTKQHGALRRRLFSDGEQEVRVAALTAAGIAADPADMEPLLEAARLDPYPLARTLSIRAAGVIGGERAVIGLKDLWAQADEPAREAIADAWGSPRARPVGGLRELSWAVDTQRGPAAIAAAAALTRGASGDLAEDAATAVLARAIFEGSSRERIFAIRVARLSSPSVREAVARAAVASDEEVMIAAASRLLGATAKEGAASAAERPALVQRLLGVARSDHKVPALLAKSALAQAGAREVLPLLDRDAHGADAQARKAAGIALIALGELPRAAVVAADVDPRVRASVSCALIRAEK